MNVVLDERYLKENTEYTGVHPLKFMLWIAMASMTMFFMGLTSALVIKRGDYQVWEGFKLPVTFLYSTIAILAVSVFMHMALWAYRASKFGRFRWLLALGTLCGVLFLLLQWNALHSLDKMGMPLSGNISGSFLHLISYMHAGHIVLALGVTLIFLIIAIRKRKDPIFEMRNTINPKRLLYMELLMMFWHYIDAVWIYLYLFFYFNYQ